MKIRVVQIWGFLMALLGWIFVACTMAMEGWKISAVGGQGGSAIIRVGWYWSSLWRSCFTDSTAVSNCYDFPVLWSVEGYIQIVRGLLMSALSLGMLGFILSLIGMECTYIGGKDRSKQRKLFAGGLCHVISGVLSMCGYVVYAQYVSMEFFNPDFTGLRFDLGTPLFLGWVGSAIHSTGGFFYLWSVCRQLCGGQDVVITIQAQPDPEQHKPTVSTVSNSTSGTKMSSISELSSSSNGSKVSFMPSTSRSDRTSRSDQTSGSDQTSRSDQTSGSDQTSRSDQTSGSDQTSRSDQTSGSDQTSRSSGSMVPSESSQSEWETELVSRSSKSYLSMSRSGKSRTVSSWSRSLRSESKAYNRNAYI